MFSLKILMVPIILFLPLLASAAEIPTITIAPRITAVTVYPDRAMVRRTATVELKPGSYQIDLMPLPVLMQDDSFRVEGTGSAGATITGMEVKRIFLEQTPEKRSKELENEIIALQRRLASLEARKGGFAAQKQFIESIRLAWGDRISKDLAAGKPTAAELSEALSFIGTSMTTTGEKTVDLEMDKVKITEQIEALNQQLQASRGSTSKEIKSVVVGVEVTKAGTLTLDLSGIIFQAGWEPSYDMRLAGDTSSVAMAFKGQVRQQTGEDWENVTLSLSTARPAVGGVPPEVYPWTLSFQRPQPMHFSSAMAPAPMPKAARMLEAQESADGMNAPKEEAQHLTAQVFEEQTSVVFQIPRQVDIPSDGTRHAATVAVEKLPVSLEYLAVPKLSPYTYLRGELLNSAPYPLLPGKVHVFTGGNYVGSSTVRKIAAGEKFELYFGIDDQITVKREELKQHKEAGLFSSNRQVYSYGWEAISLRKEPCTLIVKDQMPVAADEEIKVSLDESVPKPDEIKKDGSLLWKLQLEPGKKKQGSFTIKVEYPKDRAVSGL